MRKALEIKFEVEGCIVAGKENSRLSKTAWNFPTVDKDVPVLMDKLHSDTELVNDTGQHIDCDSWHRYAVGQPLADTLPH